MAKTLIDPDKLAGFHITMMNALRKNTIEARPVLKLFFK